MGEGSSASRGARAAERVDQHWLIGRTDRPAADSNASGLAYAVIDIYLRGSITGLVIWRSIIRKIASKARSERTRRMKIMVPAIPPVT